MHPTICAFFVALSVIYFIDGLKVLHNVRVSSETKLDIYGISLPSCGQKCTCFKGCSYFNYKRSILLCELLFGPVEITLQNSIGYVTSNVSNVSALRINNLQEHCSLDDAQFCPEIDTDKNTTIVLGNLKVYGSKRAIRCRSKYQLDGPNTTTCGKNGAWSYHGKCVKVSTMRMTCQTDSDCVVDDSECRNNTCWCKVGLSHNRVTNSCVALCPGQYGNTFQSIDNYFIRGENKYGTKVGSVDDCMTLCLTYNETGYTCKYVDFVRSKQKCNLNDIPDGTMPVIKKDEERDVQLLQRDCAD